MTPEEKLNFLKRGWNDALEDKPYDREMSLHPMSSIYEWGRLLVAELRLAAENGEQPIGAWKDEFPSEAFQKAKGLYEANKPDLSVADAILQQLLHRAPREPEPQLYTPKRKRRRAVRSRW